MSKCSIQPHEFTSVKKGHSGSVLALDSVYEHAMVSQKGNGSQILHFSVLQGCVEIRKVILVF